MAQNATPQEKRCPLISMTRASGVAFLSGSVVNVAPPKIANALNTGLSGLQWVVDSYLLTLSSPGFTNNVIDQHQATSLSPEAS